MPVAPRSSRCTPAWTEKQKVITNALNEFEASLTSTERDNVSTDETPVVELQQHASPARLTGTELKE